MSARLKDRSPYREELHRRLTEAVAAGQYELAAELADRLEFLRTGVPPRPRPLTLAGIAARHHPIREVCAC